MTMTSGLRPPSFFSLLGLASYLPPSSTLVVQLSSSVLRCLTTYPAFHRWVTPTTQTAPLPPRLLSASSLYPPFGCPPHSTLSLLLLPISPFVS
ncbi:hypothetical protein C8R45DRAFT_965554 [Mycena sanguinolenta]|nr:hypothetical protein C8R45DRAFT_965554 [Mycena sanguinolenta]